MKNLGAQKETPTTSRKWFNLIQKRAMFGPISCLSGQYREEQKRDTFKCDSRGILNADAYPPWIRMDTNELQLIKPIRDSFLQDQQTNQTCYIIVTSEGEIRCSLLYMNCFSLGSLVFYIKANICGRIFCLALKLLFVLSCQRGTSLPLLQPTSISPPVRPQLTCGWCVCSGDSPGPAPAHRWRVSQCLLGTARFAGDGNAGPLQATGLQPWTYLLHPGMST